MQMCEKIRGVRVFCSQLRHCSQNETEATQRCESPEIAFANLVREGREEVRVSKLTAEEKRDLVRAKHSEISNFMKHAAVHADTRSGVHPTALMRMIWVITLTQDSSLKAKTCLVVLGFTDPQLGAKPTASPTVSRRGRRLLLTVAGSQGMGVFKVDANSALGHRCEPTFTTVFVLLDGLTQVGFVAVKGLRKVGIWLESRTHLSCNKQHVRLA